MDEMQAEMQHENDELKKGIALKDKEIEARTKENAEEIEFMNNNIFAFSLIYSIYGDKSYTHRGDRSKEAIIEFAKRANG